MKKRILAAVLLLCLLAPITAVAHPSDFSPGVEKDGWFTGRSSPGSR